MSVIHFNVNNQLSTSVDENVLVFLVPKQSSPNFQFAAWQSLNIGTAGSEPFDYIQDIQVQVIRDNGSVSAKFRVNPGEIWDAVADNVNGVKLVKEDASTGAHAGDITDDQCAVVNTIKGTMLTTHWFVNGNACVAMPGLNQGSMSIYELEASLYFRAATPTVQGFNFTLQQVSDQTQYILPASATSVEVDWSRPGGPAGVDTFSFNPPSAQIP